MLGGYKLITLTNTLYGKYYCGKSLKMFLKRNNLPFSGSLDEKVNRINSAIEHGKLTESLISDWHSKLVLEGNKHMYIYSLERDDCNNLLASPEIVDNIFNQINNKYFNQIERLSIDNNNTINIILKVEMNYCEYDEETGEPIIQKPVAYFVVIDIYLNDNQLIISFDPPTNLYENSCNIQDENITSINLSIKYLKFVKNYFKLRTYNNKEEYIDVLNFMWNEVNAKITESLMPFTQKIQQETEAYVNKCIGNLDVTTSLSEKTIAKLLCLWEWVIISSSKQDFKFENEYGTIITEGFKGKSGANLKFGNKDKNVNYEQLHFDLKGTKISGEAYKCNSLKFSWNNNICEEKGKINTILECNTSYFRIIFTQYADKEEIDYVLSKINEIKGKI